MSNIKKLIENICFFFIRILYKIIGKEMTEEAGQTWMQFIGFIIVGVSNFAVNYIVYAFCLKYIGLSFHWSNVVSFTISVFNAFYWNNKYVFKENKSGRNILYTLFKTYVSYAFTGLLLTELLLIVEVDILHLPAIAGPVINLFITTPINFVLNKFWTFQK